MSQFKLTANLILMNIKRYFYCFPFKVIIEIEMKIQHQQAALQQIPFSPKQNSQSITIMQLRSQNQFLKQQLSNLMIKPKMMSIDPQVKVGPYQKSRPYAQNVHQNSNRKDNYRGIFDNQGVDSVEEAYRNKMDRLKMKKSPRNSIEREKSEQKCYNKVHRAIIREPERIRYSHQCGSNFIQPNVTINLRQPNQLIQPNIHILPERLQNACNLSNQHEQGLKLGTQIQNIPKAVVTDLRFKPIVVVKDQKGHYFRQKSIENRIIEERNQSTEKNRHLKQFNQRQKCQAIYSESQNQTLRSQNQTIRSQNEQYSILQSPNKILMNKDYRQRQTSGQTHHKRQFSEERQNKNKKYDSVNIPKSRQMRGKIYFEPNQLEEIKRETQKRDSKAKINQIKIVNSQHEFRVMNFPVQPFQQPQTTKRLKNVLKNIQDQSPQSLSSIQNQIRDVKKLKKQKLNYNIYLSEEEDK